MIVLYGNHCPNCRMLEALLGNKKLEYTEITDIDEILLKGLTTIPQLEVDGKFMKYDDAKEWVKNYTA